MAQGDLVQASQLNGWYKRLNTIRSAVGLPTVSSGVTNGSTVFASNINTLITNMKNTYFGSPRVSAVSRLPSSSNVFAGNLITWPTASSIEYDLSGLTFCSNNNTNSTNGTFSDFSDFSTNFTFGTDGFFSTFSTDSFNSHNCHTSGYNTNSDDSYSCSPTCSTFYVSSFSFDSTFGRADHNTFATNYVSFKCGGWKSYKDEKNQINMLLIRRRGKII